MLIHNAFVYDEHGNALTYEYVKGGAIKYTHNKGNYAVLKAYNDIKIYAKKTINGKLFYRIAKDKPYYVKAANVGKKLKTQKVNISYTIKVSKKSKVRLYNSKGKYLKKYIAKNKKVIFDQKKFIKDSVFYHIKSYGKGHAKSGYWVRKENINLKEKNK